MSATSVVVATHGHCFDGLCSSVVFTKLLRSLHPGRELAFDYKAMGYGPGQNGVDPKVLAADINAILDYRFSSASSLTWYFDHHITAFGTSEERAAYDAHVEKAGAERRFFHDGAYGSCTKLIADVGRERFGLDVAALAEMIRWADIIDSAAFPNAEVAVLREEPALQLMTIVEHHGDGAFVSKMVPRLLSEPFGAIVNAPDVREMVRPLLESHRAFVELVRAHAGERGPVVYVDLTESLLEVAGKFVTYALYPKSAYSVVVSRSKSKVKISIGYNPWSPTPRAHNIAQICERYGGGGHPVVGAISVPADRIDDGRRIAEEVTAELMT